MLGSPGSSFFLLNGTVMIDTGILRREWAQGVGVVSSYNSEKSMSPRSVYAWSQENSEHKRVAQASKGTLIDAVLKKDLHAYDHQRQAPEPFRPFAQMNACSPAQPRTQQRHDKRSYPDDQRRKCHCDSDEPES